jgi:hypothetical protein
VFEGVNQTTGQPNTVELERTEAFWRRFGAFDTHENMVEDATATRVRELTLQYTLPRETAQRFHLQSLQVYATGRNLKIWTKNSNGDPAGSVYGSDNAGGQYYRFFPAPQTRGWYVGLRTGF